MGYMSMFKDYRNTLMKALCSSKDIVNLLKGAYAEFYDYNRKVLFLKINELIL